MTGANVIGCGAGGIAEGVTGEPSFLLASQTPNQETPAPSENIHMYFTAPAYGSSCFGKIAKVSWKAMLSETPTMNDTALNFTRKQYHEFFDINQ
jgi:hypothetical protein